MADTRNELADPIPAASFRLGHSRLAVWSGLPAALAALGVPVIAAALAGSIWPLTGAALGGVALASWCRRVVHPVHVELRGGSLMVDLGDGRRWRAELYRAPAVTAVAVELRCRLWPTEAGRAPEPEEGMRRNLVVWRDALPEAEFRQLARLTRSGRMGV